MEIENRLGDALSPYLRQHADQAIAWQPWDGESLALARRLDRPILLSIGYSACHWCHVMADEAFSDAAIAEQLNRDFVCIKVDREERPDLDRIYQLAHQLLTGQGGGWPLTVFLDPDSQAPFFAGTYYPVEASSGLMGFADLLGRIQRVWVEQRDELRTQHLQVQQALKAIAQPHPADEALDPDSQADSVLAQAAARFDREHGGFGQAPKFPQAPLLRLLDGLAGDEQADQMLADSLTAMSRYGLMDQLGGGFFRYSVDAAWEIPHFEKMLSDNALLLRLYARAAKRWQRDDFKRSSELTVEWMSQVMRLDGGGYAASLDADSDSGEGAYYLWQRDALAEALPGDDVELARARYGLDGPANWDNQAWHLLIAREVDELTRADQPRDQIQARLDAIRQTLLDVRQQREAPRRDDKLIAAWNGLAIEALASAGRLLGRPEWQQQAADDLDAVAVRLFGQEPPRSVWLDGRSAQVANLDDHAAVLLACLELLRYRFESRWFNLARRLARRIERHFIDDDNSTVYFTSNEAERLLARPLALADDATPSGAGLALLGLSRLGALGGDARLHRLGRLLLEATSGDIGRSPMAHASLIEAARQFHQPQTLVLIGGEGPDAEQWQQRLADRLDLACYRLSPGLALEEPPARLASLAEPGPARALICLADRCLPPCSDWSDIERQLSEQHRMRA
ncbi:MAG: thioredoxin domain-containing protein [Wenzhouxiangella sp.]